MDQTDATRNNTSISIVPIVCIVLGVALWILVFFGIELGHVILFTIPLGIIALILSIIGKKKLLIVLSIFVMLSIVIGSGFVHLMQSLNDRTISLPNTEDVARIDIGTLSTTSQEDINTIMSALSGAKMVSQDTMNEQPLGQNQLKIVPRRMFYDETGEFFAEVIGPELYLYTNGGNDRLWYPYVGVFRISQENTVILRQLYADMAIESNAGNEAMIFFEDLPSFTNGGFQVTSDHAQSLYELNTATLIREMLLNFDKIQDCTVTVQLGDEPGVDMLLTTNDSDSVSDTDIQSFMEIARGMIRDIKDENINIAIAERHRVNQDGQTYGTAYDPVPENMPDLIEAVGVDGTVGYIKKTDIFISLPESTQEHLELLEQRRAQGAYTIPLYDSDGVTVIGEFPVGMGR